MTNRPASDLESTWDFYWRALAQGAPEPTPEYKFDAKRRWQADRAWPEARVIVELEGGIYRGGRHVRGAGFRKDCEKYNAATAQGWKVFRFTSDMLADDPESCVKQVLTAVWQVKG